ncbi:MULTISPECIES: dipeptidase [Streptacidiphilus]|uniref:Dipeptidase n=2 Tax=Streptacidiphilus TaxID=228398 RepID=A0ABV6V0L0_9ACTN|nr:dipeptidase [Streptacidiphilus jeojiense]
MTSAAELHRQSIVIDGCAPLMAEPKGVLDYMAGGFTAVAATVSDNVEGAAGTLRNLGRVHNLIRSAGGALSVIRRAADIEAVKAAGTMGVILHFQGGDPIENRLDYIDAYKSMGVNMIQLTYNVKNRIGDGCEERTDAGLSRFGLDVVKRLNEARIVVDCSHTGFRTTMETIEASERPAVFSHAGVRAVHPSPRNIVDDQIKAIAQSGGLVGANAYPPFVSGDRQPGLNQLIDHIKYVADLVGVDHIGLGLDYFSGQHPYSSDEDAAAFYQKYLETGEWSPASYPPPPYLYPKGIETPDKAANLTEALVQAGFSTDEVQKIIGGNWMRVFREVWGE